MYYDQTLYIPRQVLSKGIQNSKGCLYLYIELYALRSHYN